MQLSSLKIGVAAAFALALAACAGNGAVPSSAPNGASPFAVPDKKPTSPPVNTPCSNLTGTWDFLGSCKRRSLNSAGGVPELKRYGGIAVNLNCGTDATGAVPFLFGDATGNGDITGTLNSAPFPVYGTSCVDPSSNPITCTGTAVVYLEAINTTTTAVNLTSSPRIDVTDQHGYPGKSCAVAVLQASGAWMITPITGNAKKHALSIKSLPLAVALPPGGFYLTIACQ